LMIRKLRNDWVALKTARQAQADPKQYWLEFHDRFLSYGSPPIPLVRQAMLGEGQPTAAHCSETAASRKMRVRAVASNRTRAPRGTASLRSP
jgi:hypothetical protein